jgi:hypothetical protein
VHVVNANVCNGAAAPAAGPIELGFDRLLLPASVADAHRGSRMPLRPAGGKDVVSAEAAYDPVARIVTITPDASLTAGQMYEIDVSGVRAVDGMPIDPAKPIACQGSSAPVVTFAATAGAAGEGGAFVAPIVDYCSTVSTPGIGRIFSGSCGTGNCHSTYAAEGLQLIGSTANLNATAIGKVSVESNTGPLAAAGQQGAVFGIDMPVIDPGLDGAGNPGNSMLIYKILMAAPKPGSVPPTNFHTIPWDPLPDAERTILSNFIPGREMPYPNAIGAPLDRTLASFLTWEQMEDLSRWISEPRPAGTSMTTCR